MTYFAPYTNICSIVVACALIPRLSLRSALADRRELIGKPIALAPEPGAPQVVGEASGAAEAFGVRAGMRLAEALSRCPGLMLAPPDPVRAEAVWEQSLRRLEEIGAAVEPARPGEAFFAPQQLRAMYGSTERALARAHQVLEAPARVGAGPNRICAAAAAMRMRARRPPLIVTEAAARRLIAELPVSALRDRLVGSRAWSRTGADTRGRESEEASCIDSLQRLGIRTLGELAALPAEAVADRFGGPGLKALRLARGADEPLRPRRPHEELACHLDLPEAASGQQLERVLELLIERLLAHPTRTRRTFRRLRLEAHLAGGGGWRRDIAMRSACSSAERLKLALTPHLGELPGPADRLGLRAVELGAQEGDQAPLAPSPEDERRGHLAEAVRQARAAAGRDAVLQVIEVDPASRVPERRAILSPFGEMTR